MRISKTVSVSMPPAQLRQAFRLAKKENRTISELIREALRQYQQKLDAPINHDLIAALRAVQKEARKSGLSKMIPKRKPVQVRTRVASRRGRPKNKQPAR